jgi:hypothetical protein
MAGDSELVNSISYWKAVVLVKARDIHCVAPPFRRFCKVAITIENCHYSFRPGNVMS